MTGHYDSWKPATLPHASASSSHRCPLLLRTHVCAGVGEASRWNRRKSGQRARSPGEAAGSPQGRLRGVAESAPAVRRSQCHAGCRRETPADVTGADLRTRRRGRRLVGRGTRAVCSRVPQRRYRSQFLRLSPHARRLYHGVRRACTRLRGHSRRRRKHGATARGDRALQADRVCRYAGLPEDPARYRRKNGKRCVVAQARSCLGCRVARIAP